MRETCKVVRLSSCLRVCVCVCVFVCCIKILQIDILLIFTSEQVYTHVVTQNLPTAACSKEEQTFQIQ